MKMLKAMCVGFAICGCALIGTAWAGSGASADRSNFIVTGDYIIGPQDVLEISVWRNPDLSRQVTVRPDGRISLPLIGDVGAVGKTTGDLKSAITEKLKEYKENPTVAIVVQQVKDLPQGYGGEPR